MIEKVSDNLDKAEIAYLETKRELREAKDRYELSKSKTRTIIRTEFSINGKKHTLQEIDDRLNEIQSDITSELGREFIKYTTKLAKKERAFQEKKKWERRYWDAKT